MVRHHLLALARPFVSVSRPNRQKWIRVIHLLSKMDPLVSSFPSPLPLKSTPTGGQLMIRSPPTIFG